MKELNNKELLSIEGGINITGSFINSIVRGVDIVLDLGRSVGTAIRRYQDNSICPL